MPFRVFFSSHHPSGCLQSDATQADRHFAADRSAPSCRWENRAREWAQRALLCSSAGQHSSTPGLQNDFAARLRRGNRAPGAEFPHAERQNLMWFENDTTLDPIRDDERYKA
jgi:hypothetical protein